MLNEIKFTEKQSGIIKMNQFGYFIDIRFVYNNAKQKKQRRPISEENEKVFLP